MKEIKICIAGLGNVGSSVVQSLIDSKNFINLKSNFNIKIIGISAKNKNKKRIFDISKYKWFDNPLDFLNTDCDIVIELIGEEKGLSYNLVKSSLKKGNGEFLITLPNIFKHKFIYKGVKTYDNKDKIS